MLEGPSSLIRYLTVGSRPNTELSAIEIMNEDDGEIITLPCKVPFLLHPTAHTCTHTCI